LGYDEGRDGVVVAFMAILELSTLDLVQITQTEAYGPIHIRPHVGSVGQDEGYG
jgi:segregation and condensation protein A